MRKIEKKFVVILMSLVFILSGLTSASAISIRGNKVGEQEIPTTETGILTKTVTLYRVGPDGSYTPIKVNLELKDDLDLDEAIDNKLDELLENDKEIQQLLNESTPTFGLAVRIKSKGKGFHFQTLFLEKLLIRFVLFKLGLPRITPIIVKPFIFCRYPRDPNANTTIKPILRPNVTKYGEENHSVIIRNFVGYTTWCRRISFSPFNVLARRLSGYAKWAITI